MTHHTVDYRVYSHEMKRAKAMKDIKDWLGLERFRKIDKAYRALRQPSRHAFALQISFAGISGFPVHVWYEELWKPPQHDMHVYAYYVL